MVLDCVGPHGKTLTRGAHTRAERCPHAGALLEWGELRQLLGAREPTTKLVGPAAGGDWVKSVLGVFRA